MREEGGRKVIRKRRGREAGDERERREGGM
jgi:hypothetical protein